MFNSDLLTPKNSTSKQFYKLLFKNAGHFNKFQDLLCKLRGKNTTTVSDKWKNHNFFLNPINLLQINTYRFQLGDVLAMSTWRRLRPLECSKRGTKNRLGALQERIIKWFWEQLWRHLLMANRAAFSLA